MLSTLRFLIVVLVGCLAGLASAWWALSDPRFDFTPNLGAWRRIDVSAENDPYARARSVRGGWVALGESEGLALIALATDRGEPLSPACFYRIAGPMPKSVLWTITVTGHDGALPRHPSGCVGFSSYDAFRYGPDNAVSIVFGPHLRPGNSIPVTGLRSVSVMLRLYSATLVARPPAATDLPSIVLESCPGEDAR